jgi:oligoribonuclease
MTAGARTERRQDARNLAWLDVEASGLDAERDVILQVSIVITGPELAPLEEFVAAVWQPDAVLEKMAPIVREHHASTGLIERVRVSRSDLATAERQALALVAGWCPFPAVLAGSMLDLKRRFLERSLPGLARYLSFRSIDVGTLRTLARLWYPDAQPFNAPIDGTELGELRRSIAELSHYRRAMFRGSHTGSNADASPTTTPARPAQPGGAHHLHGSGAPGWLGSGA